MQKYLEQIASRLLKIPSLEGLVFAVRGERHRLEASAHFTQILRLRMRDEPLANRGQLNFRDYVYGRLILLVFGGINLFWHFSDTFFLAKGNTQYLVHERPKRPTSSVCLHLSTWSGFL